MRLENNELILTNRDVSAIAKRVSKAAGIAHTKAIDLIAESLGYNGGNVLMSLLKSEGDRDHAAADEPAPPAISANDQPTWRQPGSGFPLLEVVRQNFSDRELRLLTLFATGYTLAAASEELQISPRTVDTLMVRVREKLESRTTNQALSRAIHLGLISRETILEA